MQNWLARREALRVIARDRRYARDVAKGLFIVTLERAEAAVQADQHAQALAYWQQIKEQFYHEAVHSARMSKLLLEIHAYDEAEALMQHGLELYPNRSHFVLGHAYVADSRGDTETAIDRWTFALKKFPGAPETYARLASCLAKVGEFDKADDILRKGLRVSHNDTHCLISWARLAESRGDLEEAIARWQHMRELQPDRGHPTYQNGTLGLAACLRESGRFDEARKLIEEYIAQLGTKEAPIAELARIAEARGDWAEAIRQWGRFVNGFPLNDYGYNSLISAAKSMGDTELIKETYLRMVDRFADKPWPAVEYSRLATSKADQEESAIRLRVVNETFPEYEDAYLERARILEELGRTQEAAK